MLPKNNLIRRLFSRFRRLTRARKAWLIGGVVTLSLLIYLLISLFGISASELRLAALRRSWRQEPVCRDECMARRRSYRQEIVAALESDPSSALARRIRRYFLDEEEARDFRTELITIWREASSSPPDYMAEYGSDPVLAGRVLSTFPSGQATDYLQVIADAGDVRLRTAAVRALSSDSAAQLSRGQAVAIGELASREDSPERLRPYLVMLLGDYYHLYPEECSNSLRSVYSSRESGNISRALAADLLNRYEPEGGPDGGRWIEPEVPAAEWEEYYND